MHWSCQGASKLFNPRLVSVQNPAPMEYSSWSSLLCRKTGGRKVCWACQNVSLPLHSDNIDYSGIGGHRTRGCGLTPWNPSTPGRRTPRQPKHGENCNRKNRWDPNLHYPFWTPGRHNAPRWKFSIQKCI